MNRTFTLLSLIAFGWGSAHADAPGSAPGFTRCGQAQHNAYLRSKDPNFDLKMEEMEKTIQEGVNKMNKARLRGENTFAQYTIPIVVHVVYKTAAENISDAKIQAAVAQLNMDWSRTHTDTGNTPAAWKGVAADMQIQFCLATKDNSGNPTNGIVRKLTSTTEFSSDDGVKAASSGGSNPWNVNKYMNIWVCNLGSQLLGYGDFPPVSQTYGTVVHYITIGSMTSPTPAGGDFGYGRTLSHEIGHCFSLYHIWGNVSSGCSNNSDSVNDTPSMDGPTSGCPSGEKLIPGCAAGGGSAASNVSPGRMYQNFMDYTNDLCYNMFTLGQKTRCQNTISQYLLAVANSSATVCVPIGIDENFSERNVSLYPNPSTGEVFISVESVVNSVDLKVFNVIGKAVLSRKIEVPWKETKVDLSNNPNGIYFFELKTSEGTVTRKIVIDK